MLDKAQNIGLSIAGFDPCGGAGVLADIQTMQQCKVQGMSVLTATTVQNEDRLAAVDWLAFDSIQKQLELLFEKYQFKVVKIGVVQNLDMLNLIINLLLNHEPEVKIIWDPILKSTSGFDFLKDPEPEHLKSILDKVFLITPNLPEYELLKRSLDTELKSSVLIKGGHREGDDTSDLLIYPEGHHTHIQGQRIEGISKHGTGCVLSSAIAAGLIKGMNLKSACTFGKRYVETYIKSGVNKLGKHYEIEL